jgi:hypothetical protein
MCPDSEGNVQFKIIKGAEIKNELIFIGPTIVESESDPAATAADASIEESDPVDEVCESIIHLYIAGDIKFEFTMAGRYDQYRLVVSLV